MTHGFMSDYMGDHFLAGNSIFLESVLIGWNLLTSAPGQEKVQHATPHKTKTVL